MATPVIALGGWKGAPISVTFATSEEAMIMREAANTYLRLYVHAGEASQSVCQQFVSAVDQELRDTTPALPPEPSLNPPNLNADATGGPSNTFDVISDGEPAPWTAMANDSWLNVISPGEPTTGDGAVVYAISPNTGDARTGTISITGLNLTFTVNQASGLTVGTA